MNGNARPEKNNAGSAVLRILTFSTLYPNSVRTRHGIFVEQRLRHLIASGEVHSTVVAPVPLAPDWGWLGEAAGQRRAPEHESRHGLEIWHPRYVVIPKVGMTAAPWLLTAAVSGVLRRLHASAPFDLIDAHYLYPDGVAAVACGRRLGIPVVLTARGTDVNLIPNYYWARHMILWAARRSAAVITVSQALKDRLVEIGIEPNRITTLRNGVDLAYFRPLERERERATLGIDGPTLLSVGHLIERKGHHVVISALRELPGVTLVIAGDGPMERELRDLARQQGVARRVRFVGAKTHAELVSYYNAADALVLASDREGMPNVVLECLACGTPVIATAVWGTPEIMHHSDAGRLVCEREPAAIAAACRDLFAGPPARAATRRHAEQFSWDQTTRGQLQIFRQAIGAAHALAREAI